MISIGLVNEKREYYFSCEYLDEMPQDCDFKEPNRKIEIYGQKLNIAASYDNKTVFIIPSYEVRKKLKKTAYTEVVTLYSNETNKTFKVTIDKLKEKNINILDVIKIYSRNGSITGYVIKTDNFDTYRMLIKYTI